MAIGEIGTTAEARGKNSKNHKQGTLSVCVQARQQCKQPVGNSVEGREEAS
jgi:hypothetical protein